MSESRILRGAASGVIAAAVWAAQQPVDKLVFAVPYDDVEMLGRAVVGYRDGWQAPGLALHLLNGGLFGAVFALVAPELPGPDWLKGPVAAVAENTAIWPLTAVMDRHHPAREVIPALWGSRRALYQATWRHALFGAVLGELERRLRPPVPTPEPEGPVVEAVYSANGHGRLADAALPPISSDVPPEDPTH